MLDNRVDTFLSVCEHMSYTKAANELHITQPAVSQHIKFLENVYGTKLFEQIGKRIILTNTGKLLYEKLRLIKNDEERLKLTLSSAPKSSQCINLGVTMTIGEYVIAKPISRYLEYHPYTNFKISYNNTKTLLEYLQNGLINFALVEGYFPKDEYNTMTFSSENFIAVCNKNHVFKSCPKTLSDLFSERLLIREPGSGTRNILERNLAIHNYSVDNFKHFIQVENMHSIIQFLILDCGISFLYEAAVKNEIESGSLKKIPLKDFSMRHDFTFIWQKDSIFSKETEEICSELNTAAKIVLSSSL